ncbi:MAG: transposase [Eubacterium sp.]|nr:transposase [Eubacterium sp.]MCM1417278.1 transposase [Roseburia sp.]
MSDTTSSNIQKTPMRSVFQPVEKVQHPPDFFALLWYNKSKERGGGNDKKGTVENGTSGNIQRRRVRPAGSSAEKIDIVVDFTRIYDFVDDLYCHDNGRPGIDPVVLFKMVLHQHLYGIPSLRRTAAEVSMNVAYRWFLGYMMNEQTPHFSTVSRNFKHRFSKETVVIKTNMSLIR